MAKALFRFLRGEINGFYLTNMYDTLNRYTDGVKKFFHDFNRMQFDIDTMDEDTIYNLGKFSGVFFPRLEAGEGGYGSFKLTNSSIVNGKERSERGLMDRETETFTFENHVIEDDYATDINTESTNDLKSSLAGADDEVKGYIYSTDMDVVTERGDINESKVHPVTDPIPEGVAYSEYRGNNFLYLLDASIKFTELIDLSLFFPLFKVMQYIRYNGQNLDSLCKIVSILCPNGFFKIDSITKNGSLISFDVRYRLDSEAEIDLKDQRLATLLYVVGLKFPQYTFIDVTGE